MQCLDRISKAANGVGLGVGDIGGELVEQSGKVGNGCGFGWLVKRCCGRKIRAFAGFDGLKGGDVCHGGVLFNEFPANTPPKLRDRC